MSTLTMSQPVQRRVQLEDCWRARLERVTDLSLAYHDAAHQAGLSGPGSSAARRVRMLARAAVTERRALAEIEAALDRIASGQYGQCELCHDPIPDALLAGEPQARYCARCAPADQGN
jgi:RNA polymerase-binding transcription factor DksA